jgi:hypothetical protein
VLAGPSWAEGEKEKGLGWERKRKLWAEGKKILFLFRN